MVHMITNRPLNDGRLMIGFTTLNIYNHIYILYIYIYTVYIYIFIESNSSLIPQICKMHIKMQSYPVNVVNPKQHERILAVWQNGNPEGQRHRRWGPRTAPGAARFLRKSLYRALVGKRVVVGGLWPEWK